MSSCWWHLVKLLSATCCSRLLTCRPLNLVNPDEWPNLKMAKLKRNLHLKGAGTENTFYVNSWVNSRWYNKVLRMSSQCPVQCEVTNQLLWGKVTNTNQNPNLASLPAWITVLSVDPRGQNFRQCSKINNVQICKIFLFRICQFSGWAGPPLLYVAGTAVQLELGGIDSSGRPPPWATSCRPTRPPTQRLPKVQQHLPSLRCPPQKELSKVSKAELDIHSMVHKRNENMAVNIDS